MTFRAASTVATGIGCLWRCGGTAATVLVMITGCSTPGESLESAPAITVAKVDAPLHDPVWSYRTDELVAATDDHRLAAVSAAGNPTATRTRLSARLATGRNIQISKRDETQLLVPQPEHSRVAVIDLATLRQSDDFDAGPAPSYLSEDAGLRVLLALSADGSSVTPVDLYGYRKLPAAEFAGDRAETIDGANRGREIDYHLYGPSGIRYYKGPSSPPPERGSLNLDVAATAGDRAKVTRSYVADHDGVLSAVDSRRGGDGLEVVGRVRLSSSPIRYLGTDDTRIYAVTDAELVTLETATFIGYPHGRIPLLRVTDYRSGLPAGRLHSTPLSGMAIGPHRVYLTFAGQPYVASVAKPHL